MSIQTLPSPVFRRPGVRTICHFCLSTLVLVAGLPGHLAQAADAVLAPKDKIVFIGDSITAQGAKSPTGWTRLMEQSLKETHPDSHYQFTSLGGGGQTLETWQAIEEKSRKEPIILDVKDIDVKATLDGGADVIVCMLGMNNVLAPRLSDKKEDYDLWAEHYRQFIRDLRARAHPRVFALGTPTLCTESRTSPKNVAIQALIDRIVEIAKSENCIVLPTHQAMQEMLDQGRSRQPEFHVTTDFVHPNQAGHVAIASGMLKGLNENTVADQLLKKWTPKLWNEEEETLSYQVEQLPSADQDKETFRIHYDLKNPKSGASAKVTLTVPEGWKITSSDNSDLSGTFQVEGTPDRLENILILSADTKTCRINIPAPWVLGFGNVGPKGWDKIVFTPEIGKLSIDLDLSQGKGFGEPLDIAPGKPLIWEKYIASIGYAGGSSSSALDLSAVTFFQNNDVCYGARWIFSSQARAATMKIVTLGASGKNFLSVWLNGSSVYSNLIPLEAEVVSVQLEKGWNTLTFKSNHRQWRWQFAIELVPATGDDWSDVRVRTKTPPLDQPASP